MFNNAYIDKQLAKNNKSAYDIADLMIIERTK
jgi:hypothetical protein